MIDESAPDFAVLPDGERVDLHGYTSLAVVALERQRAEPDAMRLRHESLERRLDALAPAR